MTESVESDTPPHTAVRGLQKIVVDGIGRQIVAGKLQQGALLPTEPELVEHFEVSRTSVREAMRILAAKGLVDIRPKVGTRVREDEGWNVFDTDILRWHDEVGRGDVVMRDLVEIRQLLEPSAARLAATRATMTDHGRLQHCIQAMADAVSSGNDNDYASADVDFHLAVYAASHNALLRQFGSVVADFLRRTFTVQQKVARDAEFFQVDVDRHQVVYEAINRGDGEAAEAAMLDVVLEGKNSLIEALGASR
jgi:GntR family galactonate operon transcriptional repressor